MVFSIEKRLSILRQPKRQQDIKEDQRGVTIRAPGKSGHPEKVVPSRSGPYLLRRGRR